MNDGDGAGKHARSVHRAPAAIPVQMLLRRPWVWKKLDVRDGADLACRRVPVGHSLHARDDTSIRESVHQLLSDRIHALGLADQFVIGTNSIRHDNGSEFIFAGLRHNISQIRSLEGIDLAWVEEAANISHTSWEVLIPTIRKDGSEIWISFNPVVEQDATFERFVKKPQPNSLVSHVTYCDNPWWFPAELEREAAALRARDPDAYQHIYLGHCRYTLDGAIYANELRDAQEQGRITSVLYDPSKPVSVYFDLG
jgi:phage terminase large subunit